MSMLAKRALKLSAGGAKEGGALRHTQQAAQLLKLFKLLNHVRQNGLSLVVTDAMEKLLCWTCVYDLKTFHNLGCLLCMARSLFLAPRLGPHTDTVHLQGLQNLIETLFTSTRPRVPRRSTTGTSSSVDGSNCFIWFLEASFVVCCAWRDPSLWCPGGGRTHRTHARTLESG